jgi:hypothetical protein
MINEIQESVFSSVYYNIFPLQMTCKFFLTRKDVLTTNRLDLRLINRYQSSTEKFKPEYSIREVDYFHFEKLIKNKIIDGFEKISSSEILLNKEFFLSTGFDVYRSHNIEFSKTFQTVEELSDWLQLLKKPTIIKTLKDLYE